MSCWVGLTFTIGRFQRLDTEGKNKINDQKARSAALDVHMLHMSDHADAGPAVSFHLVPVFEAGQIGRHVRTASFSSLLAGLVGSPGVVNTRDLLGLGAVVLSSSGGGEGKDSSQRDELHSRSQIIMGAHDNYSFNSPNIPRALSLQNSSPYIPSLFIMLSFSHEQIVFDYKQKRHLNSYVDLTNHSNVTVCYKFKVNRQKFYLVKPDRGVINPGQSKRIAITLHKDGVLDSFEDRFKCFYVFTTDTLRENFVGLEDRSNAQKQKLVVRINNLPMGMEYPRGSNLAGDPKNSQLKSLENTGSNFRSTKMAKADSTYQGVVRERQKRVSSLKAEIEDIQRSLSTKKRKSVNMGKQKPSSSFLGVVLVGLAGLGIGVLTSYWI